MARKHPLTRLWIIKNTPYLFKKILIYLVVLEWHEQCVIKAGYKINNEPIYYHKL